MLQIALRPGALKAQAACRLVAVAAGLAGALLGSGAVRAAGMPGGTLEPALIQHVQQLALTAARAAAPEKARVEVEVGALDARLRLAPCTQVEPYLPAGQKAWGRTRIGLRCVDGVARWNVSLPVQVQVYARALVAATPLAAGTVLAQEHLQEAEIDIAAVQGTVCTEPGTLLGRPLSRPVSAGEALGSGALKLRQWFAAGDTVRVWAQAPGFAVASEGQALSAGLDGQTVRVRFENGRTVTGRAVGDRRVEVLL